MSTKSKNLDTNSTELFLSILTKLFKNNVEVCSDNKIVYLLLHLINSSYDGVVISDKSGQIIFANQAVENISGIPISSIIGKTASELLEEGIILRSTRKILSKKPLNIVQTVKTGVEVFITSVPVYDKYRNVVCYIANYRELNELNKLKHIVDSNESHSEIITYDKQEKLKHKILEDLDEFVVKSNKMINMLDIMTRVCLFDNSILMLGESGTGKTLIAEIIHKNSLRRKKRFVQLNCGAIPENLLESELFGYEQGAFTGAQKSGKIGILEVANKGTVLLDEIGDLPYNLQVKLLKFIESNEIYRIGGIEPIKLNVRIIASTNKDLENMVKDGLFREDLYYRLNVVELNIPPLRERKEDIIPLALKFLYEFNEKYDTEKVFNTNVCDALECYSWPGNVRELKNIIERLMIFSKDKQIKENSLPGYILSNNCIFETKNYGSLTLNEAKKELEKDLIEEAIKNHSSTRKAAKALGVTHSTIIRKRNNYITL